MGLQLVTLRDEFLRLLKEDEEFRYAVVGLLGISDVQSSLRQLIDVVHSLAEGQDALRADVDRLWQENNKLWQEVRRINDNIEKLWKEIMDINRELTSLSRSYGGLSEAVGFLVEQNARHYLQSWVREGLGISIDRFKRRRVEGVGEFDGYAEVGDKVVVAEVKTTLRLRDVEDFMGRVSKLRGIVVGREVIAIIVYVKEGEDADKAIELARASGVRVIKHFGEDDFEEVT